MQEITNSTYLLLQSDFKDKFIENAALSFLNTQTEEKLNEFLRKINTRINMVINLQDPIKQLGNSLNTVVCLSDQGKKNLQELIVLKEKIQAFLEGKAFIPC